MHLCVFSMIVFVSNHLVLTVSVCNYAEQRTLRTESCGPEGGSAGMWRLSTVENEEWYLDCLILIHTESEDLISRSYIWVKCGSPNTPLKAQVSLRCGAQSAHPTPLPKADNREVATDSQHGAHSTPQGGRRFSCMCCIFPETMWSQR